ncbi:protein of unknown function [Nitrospira japonica]|uniref:Uncharacterized protein n=1 Tax=Nitrospira japonica TaxID=1325564 RepID=A0A1W1I461_9BACT|nr:protein of unknown function [Nitrospira japonica]
MTALSVVGFSTHRLIFPRRAAPLRHKSPSFTIPTVFEPAFLSCPVTRPLPVSLCSDIFFKKSGVHARLALSLRVMNRDLRIDQMVVARSQPGGDVAIYGSPCIPEMVGAIMPLLLHWIGLSTVWFFWQL